MFRGLIFVAWIGLSLSDSVRADELKSAIESIIDGKDYRQAHWGILVVDAESGKTIYERNAEKCFTPASTTKLFSCAAALTKFGPDYRFETPVFARGEIESGILRGDLILVASGDLTMGSRTGADGKTLYRNDDHTYAGSGIGVPELPDCDPLFGLRSIAKQIKAAGIKELRGELLIDDRLFERSRSSGSGPELVSPMLVNDNVVDVIVSPGSKAGEPAKVEIRPPTSFITLDAQVETTEKLKNRAASITIRSVGDTLISVRGKIPVEHNRVIRIVPISEPVLFARTLLLECMKEEGIKLSCSVLRPTQFNLPEQKTGYEKLKEVARFRSAPLSEMITVTLKVSHNLYASTLPLLLAAKSGKTDLSAGLREQGKLLRDLGVATETISFGGGAGGANADKITPRAAVDLLTAMSKRPEGKAYFEALPILGVDGTLASVVSESSPARGKVRAKTGTLFWNDLMNGRSMLTSKALAGELETAKGTKLFIAMFVNDVPLPILVTPSREGKLLGKLCEIIHQHGP